MNDNEEYQEKLDAARQAVEKLHDSKRRIDGIGYCDSLQEYLNDKGKLTIPQCEALRRVRDGAIYAQQKERQRDRAAVKSGDRKRLDTPEVSRIQALRERMVDREIAEILTDEGFCSDLGRPLTQAIISKFMVNRGIRVKAPYTKQPREIPAQESFADVVRPHAQEARAAMDRMIERPEPSRIVEVVPVDLEIIASDLKPETKLRLLTMWQNYPNLEALLERQAAELARMRMAEMIHAPKKGGV